VGIKFWTGVLAAAAVAAGADLLLPRHGWGLPVLLWTLGVCGGTLLSVRRHRPASALPWQMLALSQAAAGLGFVIQDAMGRSALDLPGVTHVLVVVSILCSITGFGSFVRLRSRVVDRYLVLDLTILLVSASVALKELALDPSMEAHPPVGISSGLSAAYILMTLVMVVFAIRLVTLPGRRPLAAWILFAAVAGNVASSLAVNALATDESGGITAGIALMFVGTITLAAALHPSMVECTEPVTVEMPTFGPLRVLGLGAALFLAPLTMFITHLRTGDGGPLLLTLGASGALTLLVMFRLRLLFAREQAAREEVAASREAFSALVHGISDVIFVVDAAGSIAYATASAARGLGVSADELTGHALTDFIHEDDTDDLTELFADIVGSGATAYRTVRVMVEGEERVFELEASDRADTPSLRGLIVVLHDVTDRHLLEGELRHQAYHDSLTSLPNRKLLVERLGEILRDDRTVSVLFVDLDDFKDVNDGLGHQAGDQLLVAVAERLRGAVRDNDVVARLGGDEFAILVQGGEESEAQRVARRIIDSLSTPFDLSGTRVNMGASVGIATGSAQSVDDLLRKADVAMYRAKAAGKGTLALFEPGMHDSAAERLSLHADLAAAIKAGEFRLLYQPVFELETGTLRSGEALVRWQHPTLGLLSPDRFIGLAEDTGLIVPLGRWVLETACAKALEWPDDVGVAVNLSPRQLERDEFVDELREVLRSTGIRPARLVLEITESVIVQDVEAIVARLSAIRAEGVRIAIDDFGTGYSSLGSLMQLPVDVLKIDRSFVSTMLEQPAGTSLVKVLIDMGRTLGLEVVAEGIERADQAWTLMSQQCHQGQGFLYSPPVEPEEFADFLGHPLPMVHLA
jgi:diguanylate cyclase (GGDEF)-like protein/PAS domain S-box-containing protein